MILLRKTLKTTIKKSRFDLEKNIRKLKKKDTSSVERKEGELECFKRIKPSDITLSRALDATVLKATLTNPSSFAVDRVQARILLNPALQKTVVSIKEKYGNEMVDSIFIENEKNIKSNLAKKLNSKGGKKPKEDSDNSSDDEKPTKKPGKKSKTVNTRKEKPPTESATTFDSFFINSKGEGCYESVVPNGESDSSSDEIYTSKAKKPATGPKQKNLNKHQRQAIPSKKRDNDRKEDNQKPLIQKKEIPKVEPAKPDDADVHPSWKAKSQMHKNHIQDFKGTKIKFDE